ncbi:hypothetical protein [Cohaesibacter gelatinilyticus]|uniref:hypothetical protein n=1 Tax=Cohaesibacter gelatinilyticus TaxID=372072 RepID=UPI003CC7EA9F
MAFGDEQFTANQSCGEPKAKDRIDCPQATPNQKWKTGQKIKHPTDHQKKYRKNKLESQVIE